MDFQNNESSTVAQGPTGPPAPAPAPAKIATTGHHRHRPKIRDLAGGLAGDFYQIFS